MGSTCHLCGQILGRKESIGLLKVLASLSQDLQVSQKLPSTQARPKVEQNYYQATSDGCSQNVN